MSNNIATNAPGENNTAEQVRTIANRVLRIDSADAQITDESNLFNLGLESLNVIELLGEIETAFGIKIDVEDLSEDLFNRFQSLVGFVQRKVNEGS